jgi:hypothetical protein
MPGLPGAGAGSAQTRENSMSMDYHDFLRSKRHTTNDYGFDAVWMPECAFDFQEHIIARAVKKGRIEDLKCASILQGR